MLIEASVAKVWSETEDQRAIEELKSVVAEIYRAIANNLYHCDWYSTPGLDADEQSVDNIIIPYLTERNYIVTKTVFKANETFTHSRIKLHINWEETKSEKFEREMDQEF